MKQQQEDNLLAKWVAGAATPEEVNILSKTYDLDELAAVLSAQKMLDVNVVDNATLYTRIEQSLNQNDIAKTRSSKWPLLFLGLIAIGVITYFVLGLSSSPTTIKTQSGQRDTILFADNTQVILGPKSMLTFDEKSFKDNRNFKLQGQGYFKVPTKGDLKVETDFGKVEVLGTEFDIYTMGEDLHRINCYEGKVKVSNSGSKTYKVVKAQESISITGSEFNDVVIIDAIQPDWTRSIVEYKNIEIGKVLSDLSRYYSNEFKLDQQLMKSTFNGAIPINDLDLSLDYLANVTGWKYDKQPDGTITISK